MWQTELSCTSSLTAAVPASSLAELGRCASTKMNLDDMQMNVRELPKHSGSHGALGDQAAVLSVLAGSQKTLETL